MADMSFNYIIQVALCAACISFTISVANIFKWLRDWVENHLPKKLDELIHCPYCLSHYVVLIIMLTTYNIKGRLIHITRMTVYDFLFTWFVIVCIVSLLHYVMVRAYHPIMEMEAMRMLKKHGQKRSSE